MNSFRSKAPTYLRKSSGSLAKFAAIRRASSLLSSLAEERRPGSSSVGQLLAAMIADDEASAVILDVPGRREAAVFGMVQCGL